MGEEVTHVYFAKCGRFVKVGIAKDPEARVADMQIGNPYPVTLLASIEYARRENAFYVEQMLHERLRRYRQRGEWFAAKPVLKAMQEKRWLKSISKDRVTNAQYAELESIHDAKQAMGELA